LSSDNRENEEEVTFVGMPGGGQRRNDTVIMGAVQRRLEAMYPYMKGHWQRIAFESAALGEELDLSQDALEQLRMCAYLMDIGMIDESIHALTVNCSQTGVDYMQNPDVRRTVERHPVMGARKLEELGFPRSIILAVRHHHEWYNGWGYPDGLSGVAIPLLARLLAVADAFVSITSDRPFRQGCTPAEALDEIIGPGRELAVFSGYESHVRHETAPLTFCSTGFVFKSAFLSDARQV